jgi:hypothetical protein
MQGLSPRGRESGARAARKRDDLRLDESNNSISAGFLREIIAELQKNPLTDSKK